MKRRLLIVVVCGMASVGWAVMALAAREAADQKAADEFGSLEAKTHLAQARAMIAATKQIWDAEVAAV